MLCFSGDGSDSVSKDMMYSQQSCVSSSSSSSFFFFFFFKVQIQREAGTVRIGLITVLRTTRSDHGSHGSLFFSHKAVL